MTHRPPTSEWLMIPSGGWRSSGGMDRRAFLKVAAAAGGGLLICVTPTACRGRSGETGDEPAEELNAFVLLDRDGWVTIQAPCPEIGQGVRTSLPMIVAGEMGARWDRCRFEQAPAADVYGGMTVGGSDSVSDYWMPLRQAGAMARSLLVAAAADRLGVPAAELTADGGSVTHGPSGTELGFGELSDAAARIEPMVDVPLRDDASLAPVGRPTGPVHAEDVVRGEATYGMDLTPPGVMVAVIARAPVRGARARSFDDRAARSMDGVLDVVEVEPRIIGGNRYGAVRAGVAVVARDTWTALQGREALSVEWETGPDADFSTEELRARLSGALGQEPDLLLREEGTSISDQERSAPGHVRRRYETPLLAHVCMEPVNFTADVRDDRVVLWGPTQNPRSLQATVAAGLERDLEQVEVHPTLAGGGFGRRLAFDYGVEAAFLSRSLGRPVKVVWSREDDIRHDYFRPPSAHMLEAILDGEGVPTAWRHHLATGSLLEHIQGAGAEPRAVYDVQGGADHPYAVSRVEFAYSSVPVGVQLGSWRSVSHSFNVFAVESFLDELAEVGGLDPLELRLRLLPGDGPVALSLPLPGRRGSPSPDRSRLRGVLEEVARSARWAAPSVPRWGKGLACCYYKNTYVAHVAEVEAGDPPRVRRVHVAVDCGRVVNPDGVAAQCEGAVADAVGSVFHWGITVDGGRVQESNFHDYLPVRMQEAPAVEVSIVSSEAPPSGMGEPPYPSAVAAIVNGIAAATGERVRRLPLAGARRRRGS